jgi:hypothetical protein
VLLPEPLGPRIAAIFPSIASNETSCTAWNDPNRLFDPDTDPVVRHVARFLSYLAS